jgi:hypothetical protein
MYEVSWRDIEGQTQSSVVNGSAWSGLKLKSSRADKKSSQSMPCHEANELFYNLGQMNYLYQN